MEFLDLINVYTVGILLLIITTYCYFTWHYNELKGLGIPYEPPLFMVGSLHLIGKHGFREMDSTMIKKHGKVFGLYEGRLPTIVVADPEIIKKIVVKEFPNFVNRAKLFMRGPILRLSVFDLEDDHWKFVRGYITPTFTSGKMRQMSPLITIATDHLNDNLAVHCKEDRDFEVKEVCGNYTMEVIASTAFGLLLDTQTEKDHPFLVQARRAFDFNLDKFIFKIIFLFPFLVPILDWLDVNLVDSGSVDYFYNICKEALNQRKEDKVGTGRTDFLKLMVNAAEEFEKENADVVNEADTESARRRGLTTNEIIAQAVVFMLAGYDTTANTFTYLMYLLAVHQECQDKLMQEIWQVLPDGEEPNYDSVSKLAYLGQCLDETLRLYPPIPRIDRRATKTIEINGVTFPKDMKVVLPIIGLHLDPEIWPDPEKFDPERFTEEAKSTRHPFTYMPFGHGPRHCIGMRLAEMELKMALVKVLQKFKLVPSEKTEIPPLEMKKAAFFTQTVRPIYLKVEQRQM